MALRPLYTLILTDGKIIPINFIPYLPGSTPLEALANSQSLYLTVGEVSPADMKYLLAFANADPRVYRTSIHLLPEHILTIIPRS